MTERDDGISRRYRELAREEPPAALDASILAAARAARPSRFARWAGPVSLAAVLVLGVGVSVRMQTEEPGIETQMPATGYAQAPAGEMPSQAEPARAQAPAPEPSPAPVPPAPSGSKDFAPGPAPESPPAIPQAPSKPSSGPAPMVASPPSGATEARQAPAQTPAAPRSEPAADALVRPAPRAKREAMRDSAGGRAMSGLGAAGQDPDPGRELERIAKARERGDHAQADRALEAFRRDHPGYRIPDAMWERVRNPAAPPEPPAR
jgi:hypothetical protein